MTRSKISWHLPFHSLAWTSRREKWKLDKVYLCLVHRRPIEEADSSNSSCTFSMPAKPQSAYFSVCWTTSKHVFIYVYCMYLLLLTELKRLATFKLSVHSTTLFVPWRCSEVRRWVSDCLVSLQCMIFKLATYENILWTLKYGDMWAPILKGSYLVGMEWLDQASANMYFLLLLFQCTWHLKLYYRSKSNSYHVF